jgi:hypothetical protein
MLMFIWPIIRVLVLVRNEANATMTYGAGGVDLRACLTSALGKLSVSGLVVLPTGKERPVSHWTGGWVGPRASLNTAPRKKEKALFLQGFELR